MAKRSDQRIGGIALLLLLAGTGVLARKATAAAWIQASGQRIPPDQTNTEVTLGEAVGWALVSGAVVGVARTLVRRRLAYRGSVMDDSLPGRTGFPELDRRSSD